MAKLIIIRGNSGSGKTSAAKALQKRFGNHTMLISQDVIRREMLRVKDGPDTLVLPLLNELLFYGYKHCNIVILEGILNAQWYMPLFQTALELFGEDIYAYYYDLPFEETVLRHQTKAKKNEFGVQDMKRWWIEKDYIKVIPEKRITAEQTLEEAVNMIMAAIQEGDEYESNY